MSRIPMVLWLTTLWIVLWRDLSFANLASGLAIATVLAFASGPRPTLDHRVHPVALVRFLAFFAWKLLEANVVLAREVVTPQNRINTGIIAVPMPGRSDLVVTVVANAVSLTPGTLSLEVRHEPEPVVYVHVLHLHVLEDARADVETMTRMVSAALEPRSTEGSGS